MVHEQFLPSTAQKSESFPFVAERLSKEHLYAIGIQELKALFDVNAARDPEGIRCFFVQREVATKA